MKHFLYGLTIAFKFLFRNRKQRKEIMSNHTFKLFLSSLEPREKMCKRCDRRKAMWTNGLCNSCDDILLGL